MIFIDAYFRFCGKILMFIQQEFILFIWNDIYLDWFTVKILILEALG